MERGNGRLRVKSERGTTGKERWRKAELFVSSWRKRKEGVLCFVRLWSFQGNLVRKVGQGYCWQEGGRREG